MVENEEHHVHRYGDGEEAAGAKRPLRWRKRRRQDHARRLQSRQDNVVVNISYPLLPFLPPIPPPPQLLLLIQANAAITHGRMVIMVCVCVVLYFAPDLSL